MIKNYKLFLESNGYEELKKKVTIICEYWWEYNKYKIGIKSLSDFFVELGISTGREHQNLNNLINHTLDMIRPMINYGDKEDIENTNNLIDETYSEINQLIEESKKLPTLSQVRDHMLHIIDILDEYHNPDITQPADIEMEKEYSRIYNCFTLLGEFSTTVYHGTTISNASLDSERTNELTERILKELEFTKDSIESDFKDIEFTYNRTDSYNGIKFVIKVKK